MAPSDDVIERAAFAQFGIKTFRPKQKEIIRSILEGNNTLAVLPTGAGKSLTYQLPAMLQGGLTIVVTPLISLMKDQLRVLEERGVAKCAAIFSGLPRNESDAVLGRTKELKLLYVTPERLELGSFREALLRRGVHVRLVVIDEAHCVSLWGNTFRPSYRRIGDFLSAFPDAVVAAFTGTATEELKKDICRSLGRINWTTIAAPMKRENLSLSVLYTDDKTRQLTDNMDEKLNTVVYTSSRTVCEKLDYIFRGKGLPSTVYHAGLSGELREKNQKLFMDGEKKIMVATSAFGMGIDKKDIRNVFHFHVPFDAESYYQEVGRAGRDGLESEAVLLVEPGDMGEMEIRTSMRFPEWNALRRIVRSESEMPSVETAKRELAGMFSLDEPAGILGYKKEYLLKRKRAMEKARFMMRFVSSSSCRSAFLLSHFGEEASACGKCDHCRSAAERFHSGAWRDEEIRFIAALGGYRGKVLIEELRSVLTGMRKSDRLKGGFGSLRGTDRKAFGGIVNRLKNFSVLEMDPGNASVGLNPLFKKML